MANVWCDRLGITPPVLETVVGHRDANTYALFLVALLERGAPMTLPEVAARFETAGVAPAADALRSLQRCKPARPPAYRDGEQYHLDPHDDEIDLWVSRLGLRPPKVAPPVQPAPVVVPVRAPDEPLTAEELDDAWRGASLSTWSSLRLALAVLDAHGGPLAPADVVANLAQRTRWASIDGKQFDRRGSPIRVLEDGRWEISPDGAAAMTAVREAVRALATKHRERPSNTTSADEMSAASDAWAKRRAARAAGLSRLSRAILVVFPPSAPRVAALVDVGARTMTTYAEADLDRLRADLATYDFVAGVDIRAAFRALGCASGEQRLGELGSPQKTIRLDNRTFKLTTAHFVQGSCGIEGPFGDPEKLAGYLARGETTKLLRRLEADAKSLYALHEYGRLHGSVRLRSWSLDERFPAPWVHRDETKLYQLKASAIAIGAPLEVVAGSAPGWEDPWARVQRVSVVRKGQWDTVLVDARGYVIPDADIQRARLAVALH